MDIGAFHERRRSQETCVRDAAHQPGVSARARIASVNREFFIIAYRTDPDALKAVIPAPLEFTDPIVKYEFIRMPDSTGFGDYTESGQVIPVSFRGEKGGYVHAMYLDCDPPIAGGRELWGFPKKLASPMLKVEKDTLLRRAALRPGAGRRRHDGLQAPHRSTMQAPASRWTAPGYLLKIIPHVDGKPRICELVRYRCGDVDRPRCLVGPAALELFHHALAPVAALPVLEVISAIHILCDLTLELGTVIHDYLA